MRLVTFCFFALIQGSAQAAFGVSPRPPSLISSPRTLHPRCRMRADADSSIEDSSGIQDVDVLASTLRSVTFAELDKSQEPMLLCEFLMELGACSTSITDADKDKPTEEAIYGEPTADFDDDPWQSTTTHDAAVVCGDAAVGRNVWRRCNVTAHFPASTDLQFVSDMVRETLDLPLEFSTVNTVPDRDWVVHVQQSWKPILISGLVLRFPWHSDDDVREVLGNLSPKDVVELQLEGGIAFGTGEHPTTQLCLEWIQKLLRDDDRNEIVNFMDYGAGSGVLGLSACQLSDEVMAIGVDIDVDAVRIANANAETNGLSMFNFLPPLEETEDGESKSVLMKAYQKDAAAEVLPEKSNGPIYDALVANILAGPLVTLAPTLASLVRAGGHLGLSGILTSQSDMVMMAYTQFFDDLKVQEERGGWSLVTGRRKK